MKTKHKKIVEILKQRLSNLLNAPHVPITEQNKEVVHRLIELSATETNELVAVFKKLTLPTVTEDEIVKTLFHIEEEAVKEDEDVTIMDVYHLQAKAIKELLNQKR